MSLKEFGQKILENWPQKLLCLGLAIIVYILHSSMEYDTKTFSLPVKVIETGNVQNIENQNYNVQLKIRADSDTISNIHETDFSASIDLSTIATSGEYQFPIHVDVKENISDNYVFELRQSPQSIKLQVEKKDIAFIQIVPSIVGEPAHGYEVSKVSVEPKFVEVTGPQSILNATSSIKTEKIDISDKKTDFVSKVNAKNFNQVLNLVDEGPYTVKIEMVSSKMDKKFENIPISFTSLDEQFTVAGQYEPITFMLNGTVISLEEYVLPSAAVSVDLSEISEEGTYELPLQINIPTYFTINEKSAETVFVKIEKALEKNDEQDSQNQITSSEQNQDAVKTEQKEVHQNQQTTNNQTQGGE